MGIAKAGFIPETSWTNEIRTAVLSKADAAQKETINALAESVKSLGA